MKTKKLLFLFFILLTFVTNAQDKYDFMIIEYKTTLGNKLSVSINGKEFILETIELPKPERTSMNANPFLKRISKFQDLGWEVMNINSSLSGLNSNMDFEVHFAYLRKKKKE